MQTKSRTLTCSYISTCFPDFLHDHHNRGNELLICASANQTYSDMQEELIQSAFASDKIPSSISNEAIIEAIDTEFCSYHSQQVLSELEEEEDTDYEIYVYAYLSW